MTYIAPKGIADYYANRPEPLFDQKADPWWEPFAKRFDPNQPRDREGKWARVRGEGQGGVEDTEEWDDTVDSIRSQGIGNCYEASVTFMYDQHMNGRKLGLRNPRLIQATVMGDGGAVKGIRYGHSWVEADGTDYPGQRIAVDYSSGHSTILDAKVYRVMGQVENVHEYDWDAAATQMLDKGTYGPWTEDLLAFP